MSKVKSYIATQAIILALGCIFIGYLMKLNSPILALLMGMWIIILLEINRRDYVKEVTT